MHLFLIRTPAMDQVFHLHPQQVTEAEFAQPVPPGASGTYQAFADVVDATGLPWTLVGTVQLSDSRGAALEGDDSGAKTPPLASGDGDSTSFTLPDGCQMTWRRDSATLHAGVPM